MEVGQEHFEQYIYSLHFLFDLIIFNCSQKDDYQNLKKDMVAHAKLNKCMLVFFLFRNEQANVCYLCYLLFYTVFFN